MTPRVSTVTYTKNSYFRSRPYGRPFVPVDTDSVIHKLLVLLVQQYWWCTWSVYRASRAHHSKLCFSHKSLILCRKLKLILGVWNNMWNKYVANYLLNRDGNYYFVRHAPNDLKNFMLLKDCVSVLKLNHIHQL